jgi:hypothetical protein
MAGQGSSIFTATKGKGRTCSRRFIEEDGIAFRNISL